MAAHGRRPGPPLNPLHHRPRAESASLRVHRSFPGARKALVRFRATAEYRERRQDAALCARGCVCHADRRGFFASCHICLELMPCGAAQPHLRMPVSGLICVRRPPHRSPLRVAAGRTHLVEVGSDATVADVKALVQAREGEATVERSAAATLPGDGCLAAGQRPALQRHGQFSACCMRHRV